MEEVTRGQVAIRAHVRESSSSGIASLLAVQGGVPSRDLCGWTILDAGLDCALSPFAGGGISSSYLHDGSSAACLVDHCVVRGRHGGPLNSGAEFEFFVLERLVVRRPICWHRLGNHCLAIRQARYDEVAMAYGRVSHCIVSVSRWYAL